MLNKFVISKSLEELKLLVAELEKSLERFDFEEHDSDPLKLVPHFLKEISRIEIEVLKDAFTG